MKTNSEHSYTGYRADVGHLPVRRMLPNNNVKAIGPFIFLDHMLPTKLKPSPRGMGAHPHRGIATFTYLLSGTVEHYDSRGNHGIVTAGGIQWMKAGNGVIHEENVPQTLTTGVDMHGMQFWINLPPENKVESPKYIPVQVSDIPEFNLPAGAGSLKLLLGEFASISALIDTYSDQFMYHIKLNPQASYSLDIKSGREQAVFLPAGDIVINGTHFKTGELVVLATDSDRVTFENPGASISQIIFFGGDPYKYPIVSNGPFVMNTDQEISESFLDFKRGKYGSIQYVD